MYSKQFLRDVFTKDSVDQILKEMGDRAGRRYLTDRYLKEKAKKETKSRTYYLDKFFPLKSTT